jgi:hypothetical protein
MFNPKPWILVASRSCPCCRGSGEIREPHGEDLPCGCAFENASPEAVDGIDHGEEFIIEPNPAWIAFMDAMHRGP